MSAQILDGRAVARAIRSALQADIAAMRKTRGAPPKLAIVTHTPQASTQVYLRAKLKAASETGLAAQEFPCAPGSGAEALVRLLARLGTDASIDSIIVEQPLPKGFSLDAVFSAIPPRKDAEGVHPANYGRFFLAKSAAEIAAADIIPPCTAAAIIALLRETNVHIAGKEAVVVGRSEIVGRPVAHYLSALDATVTLCHSKTEELSEHVKRADILVTCLGKPACIKGAWIKPGAVVIDAGMNRSGDVLVGDVEFAAASETASFITPVPGGVGPVTTAIVLANTADAARRQTV